jgi:cysteine desulfurase / selenocysteine lyase
MINSTLLEYEFPQDEGMLYLNHAAVSPWPRRTAEAIKEFAEENVVFGAQNYKKWEQRENSLREQLRTLINATSVNEISLLKNTSEALSVVASGIDWKRNDNVVSTNEEFPSNRFPWQAQKKHGVELKQIAVQIKDPEQALINACDDQTRVMSVSSVQYGSGLKLKLEILGEFCRTNQILFCVDAIQSVGAHKIDVQAINADFAMADAHKWMMGPEGIALFYCRAEIREQLKLYQFGWHMVEHAGDYDREEWQAAKSSKRFECGSPNMLGAHALSASLSLIDELGMNYIEKTLYDKSTYLIHKLDEIGNIKVISNSSAERLAGIVNFQVEGVNHKELYAKLMQNRVVCAHRYGGIRFSPHFYTSEIKIDKALQILFSLI